MPRHAPPRRSRSLAAPACRAHDLGAPRGSDAPRVDVAAVRRARGAALMALPRAAVAVLFAGWRLGTPGVALAHDARGVRAVGARGQTHGRARHAPLARHARVRARLQAALTSPARDARGRAHGARAVAARACTRG